MRRQMEGQPAVDEAALISQAKAAEMCGLTRAALHDLVGRQRLRAVEVGGREMVYLKEVEAFEKENRPKP
jgi:hypothetical protein